HDEIGRQGDVAVELDLGIGAVALDVVTVQEVLNAVDDEAVVGDRASKIKTAGYPGARGEARVGGDPEKVVALLLVSVHRGLADLTEDLSELCQRDIGQVADLIA